MFLDHFNALVYKIILKKIILIYFQIKNTLKNNSTLTLTLENTLNICLFT